ncbi:MAG: FAD-dependent oxidoreductase [Gammaproteobacteria bacterium]|nr:FAD-dependent oxidoreductase [Gammaproteobacteria bacterium]NNL99314.1 FAD-dependent oxidoreductase [Gammaproteobacteria bacterium]
MRIAVVGAGISGLTAAYTLSRRHRVQVFEAGNYAGGHTNTVDIEEGARTLAIDTGFIVFNRHNYPCFSTLLDTLGVGSRPTSMSFSVHCERTGLEYNGSSPDQLFAQRRNLLRPAFYRMLADIRRFNATAPRQLRGGLSDTVTVNAYARQEGYSRPFMEYYLLPLGAALWSCDTARFGEFPMRFALEFFDNHRMLQIKDRPQWLTVQGGSRSYIDPLTEPFRGNIHLDRPVSRIVRGARGVTVEFAGGASEAFDEVIVATHADTALRLVNATDAVESALLRHFPYQNNDVVLHTDTRLLPDRRRAWGSWNYRIGADNGLSTVTYNMNMLQGLDSERTYCVSLNQTEKIAPAHILRRFSYAHPLFVPGRDSAQRRHEELIRRNGISYCGAYWGFGFHEDGVKSGLAVANAFDMALAA